MNEVQYSDALPIDGFGPGFWRVAGERHEGPILIHAARVTGWAGYDDPAPIVAIAGEVDVLFLGTGPGIAHPPAAFRAALEAAGVPVEIMASDSAARTYNVLLSEGRRVGAALLPAR